MMRDVDTIWIGFQSRRIVPSRLRSAVTVVESQPLIDLIGQANSATDVTHVDGTEQTPGDIVALINALPTVAAVNVFNDTTYDTDGVAITQGAISSGTPANTLTIGTGGAYTAGSCCWVDAAKDAELEDEDEDADDEE
jgi:hypothetical protein